MTALSLNLNEAAKQIAHYFLLNPTKHGRLRRIYKNAKGAQVKDCITLEEPVTIDLLKRHLWGRPGFLALGELPGDEDGTKSGMIDLDTKNYPLPGALDDAVLRALDIGRSLGLELYVEVSTRGGTHLHIFSDVVILHEVMSKALRVIAERSGLGTPEVYPAGASHLSTWLILPYAGAAQDGKGRTQLATADGQLIPVDELSEWIEPTQSEILHNLAVQYKPVAEAVADAIPVDLKPEAAEAICEAIRNPPAGSFERHGSLIAFINLGRRCGQLSKIVSTLKSEAVRQAWTKDGSRDADEWSEEIDRWLKATGTRQRGIKSLLEEGFELGHLPSPEPGSVTVTRAPERPRSRRARQIARLRRDKRARA